MSKRIMIFSPEQRDLNMIKWFIESYIKKNFKNYLKDIELQVFSQLCDARGNFGLGHWNEGELFVVFDQRIMLFKGKRGNPSIRERNRYSALQASYDLSKKLCDEREIPYVIYTGELVKREEKTFTKKLNDIKIRALNRLENAIG